MENKTDNQIYEDIVEEVKRIIYFNQVERAFEFQRKIRGYLKKKGFLRTNKELYKKYQRVVVKLKWVCLAYFKKEEVVGLFDKYLRAAFEIPDFDLWEKLRLFLLQFGIFKERDEIKKSIINVLNSNQAKITSKNLPGDKKPTVENWMREYVTIVGTGNAESIKLQKFFTQNKNFTTLDSKEKKRVQDFFKFYERIKLSSLIPEGTEDSVEINSDEFKGVFRDGKLEEHKKLTQDQEKLIDMSIKIVRETKFGEAEEEVSKTPVFKEGSFKGEKIKQLEEEIKKYPENSLERMMIEEEIRKIK